MAEEAQSNAAEAREALLRAITEAAPTAQPGQLKKLAVAFNAVMTQPYRKGEGEKPRVAVN